jgi:SAM-dependent methyltransferase
MSDQPAGVSGRMRADWNQRAREDARYYVAFGARGQDEEDFAATAADVLRSLEQELKRLPKDTDPRARRALEIGCGPGRLMKPLSRHFGEIHGVDVSDEMVGFARERLRDIPHAHVHATNGASLSQFASASFDFVYSYAVFQHIPSREVVLEYMRETHRVLKPGGVFRGQFNGLPHSATPDTWAGVTFSADDIRAFTREQGIPLMSLEGVQTQYMWTTWRRRPRPQPAPEPSPLAILRITNAYSGEFVAPNRGQFASLSIWVERLPDEADLNNLEVAVDGAPGTVVYIGPSDGKQQVNVRLPPGVRTGLVPVQLLWNGKPLATPAMVRLIPPGPLTPRIVSVSDGVNLSQKNRSVTGSLKVQIEEISSPETVRAAVGGLPIEKLDIVCIDPLPPRYEINLSLPSSLPPGPHLLEVWAGSRRLLPSEIYIAP